MRKRPNNTRPIYSRVWWTLHKKILLSMVSLILLSGIASVIFTRTVLLKVLKTEFQSKGVNSAKGLAANSVVDVLTQNASRLKQLIVNEKNSDKDIAYIFVIDSQGRVISHTFDKGFPVDLAKANLIAPGRPFNIEVLETQMGRIYDIAVPVFSGNSLLAHLRLGLLANSIQRTINAINLVFAGVTILIIGIAALLAYKISSLITSPVSELVDATAAVQTGDFSRRIDVSVRDEIGMLASAFNEMTSRLNQMVERIKELTTTEERTRIALDLHDCCAQDLANIIKRLELCEKLLKIEPAKAVEEMAALRKNTKDILDRTRQVIYELKSPEGDAGFNLSDKLGSYLRDYRNLTDITINSNFSSAINDLPPLKAKSIFYIIAEALTNVRKHSGARNVGLNLKSNGRGGLTIEIEDNGIGFNVEEAGSLNPNTARCGMAGMRQRAESLGGTLTIDSSPQEGTRIFVNIPMN